MAVLVSALVRLSFNVEIDPASGWVTVGRTKGLHGFTGRPLVVRGIFPELNALEPRLATERPTVADGHKDLVASAAGDKAQREVSPRLGTAHGGGVNVERHGRHGERRAGGNGRAVQVT